MTASTFFWHDYETFGRSPRRDRPAQFAGVRTDLELNALEPPVTLWCKPSEDHLPDVEACLLTGIVPQHCEAQGQPEGAFAADIARQLGAPGTVGVGFNSIAFDDEFTRFLLWRNLMDPYGREWRNGCGRWDLLGVVRCAYALRPDGIVWPTMPDGKVTFRLQELTAANGIVHDAAHDAMSDVMGTLALARRLRATQARLWEFCLKLRDARFVETQLRFGEPALHISGLYPSQRGCLAVVWPLAPHPSRHHEVIVWDLTHDPTELLSLSAADIRARLFVPTEKLPKGTVRLPITTVHKKKSPIVIQNLKTLSETQAERWGIDMGRALHHAAIARRLTAQGGDAWRNLWREVFQRTDRGTGAIDVDESLYGGFLHDEDVRNLERLRSMPPEVLAHERTQFMDERLEELVFRYRARNHPQTLNDTERNRWNAHCRARVVDGLNGARTLRAFMADVAHHRATSSRTDVLEALHAWGQHIAGRLEVPL